MNKHQTDQYKTYDASRRKDTEYKAKQAAWNKAWREKNNGDPDRRARKAEQMREYRKIHAAKHAARRRLRTEIEAGQMKPLPCEVCGETPTHGHHSAYDMPLAVTWLCVKHHQQLHNEAKAEGQ